MTLLRTYRARDRIGSTVTVHGYAICATYRTNNHLKAAAIFARTHGHGKVSRKPVGTTARGYIFKTADVKVMPPAPTKKESNSMATTKNLTDKAEVSREYVNEELKSALRQTGSGNLDWKATSKALAEELGVIVPEDGRHPVNTKLQRFFREILTDTVPVKKPKAAKPAPEPEPEEDEDELGDEEDYVEDDEDDEDDEDA